MKSHALTLIVTAAFSLAAFTPARAITTFGLTSTGLVQFDTANPGSLTNSATFSGLTGGDVIADIDFRAHDGLLYGMASSGRLYRINPLTGAAVVDTAGSLGVVQDIDFNPVANRLRVLSAADQNYRITQGTGLVSTDGIFSFAAADVNVGANPNLGSAAYTNSFLGAGSTTFFSIDTDLDVLVSHSGAPQFATLNTVGPLGVNVGSSVGFDIVMPNNTAFLSNGQDLYTVNLSTGALSSLGMIGGSGVMSIAVVPEPSSTGLGLLAALGCLARRRR